ncbi:MAG TPA: mechanosensitive ion channel domain-containing protein [Tepidisphaeraceae bacterium]|jgi:small-conductance mechanosensitive channel
MLSLLPILANMFSYNGQEVELFDVKLIGVNPQNGKKLLFTMVLIVGIVLAGWIWRHVSRILLGGGRDSRLSFWARQGFRILLLFVLLMGLISIWFNDPTRFTTFLGLVTAGIAFALQRVITAFAGYFVILRGKTFNVGDRIVMGGVRGDVIDLGFMQTRIMEMGQPPAVEGQTDPGMWVLARQYTGRIVTITNDKIFDEPVYNYTKEFPFIWEEMRIPISYKDDRTRAEQILLDAATRHTIKIAEMSEDAIHEMERRYVMRRADIQPRVFWRITDNWLELTVRFVARDHGVRGIKDAMSRDILGAFDEAGIGIASATFDIVGIPPIHMIQDPPATQVKRS